LLGGEIDRGENGVASKLRTPKFFASRSTPRVDSEQALGRPIWPQSATTATACGRRGEPALSKLSAGWFGYSHRQRLQHAVAAV